MNLTIRSEMPGDIDVIESLTRQAFSNAPHRDGNEHLIVNALRQNGALTISLVAELGGQVVGHVAVSPVTITDRSQNWFGLGPISVLPDLQRQGIGSALMRAALSALERHHARGCVLVGDPQFYNRFDFRESATLEYPGVPATYLLVRLLKGSEPHGQISYNSAFQVSGTESDRNE